MCSFYFVRNRMAKNNLSDTVYCWLYNTITHFHMDISNLLNLSFSFREVNRKRTACYDRRM